MPKGSTYPRFCKFFITSLQIDTGIFVQYLRNTAKHKVRPLSATTMASSTCAERVSKLFNSSACKSDFESAYNEISEELRDIVSLSYDALFGLFDDIIIIIILKITSIGKICQSFKCFRQNGSSNMRFLL